MIFLPVGQDNLALRTLPPGLDTLWVVERQSADMCRQPRQILGFHATECHDGAGNSLGINGRNIGTGENDAGEDHPRIGRERADLGDLVARDGGLDPVGADDGEHDGLGLGVLVEIDGIGDDMRRVLDAHPALAVGLQHLGTMVFDDLGELSAR